MPCANAWWHGCYDPHMCAIEGWKQFLQRLVWAVFFMLKTAKKHMVYIPFFVGVLLMIVGAWIISESGRQEAEVIKPLVGIDTSIDEVTDALNFVTQQVPDQALLFVRNATVIIEQELNSVLNVRLATNLINSLVRALESAFNSVSAWGEFESKRYADQFGGTAISLPELVLPRISMLNLKIADQWTNSIPSSLDLSMIRVPSREFSVEDECAPFVRNVYDIPRQIGYTMRLIGTMLVIYAVTRVALAFLWPFIPVPVGSKRQSLTQRVVGLCLRCGLAVGKSAKNIIQKFLKPHIHVPILVGTLLILCAVFLLLTSAAWMEEHMLDPVREVDKLLRVLYSEYNDFIDAIPLEIIEQTNQAIQAITDDGRVALDRELQSIVSEINLHKNIVEDEMNYQINQMLGTAPIFMSPISAVDLSIALPRILIPDIPTPDLSIFRIPVEEWSIELALQPWADERVRDIEDTAWGMIRVAIMIMFFPALSILTTFLQPYFAACSPDTAAWFEDPGFHEFREASDTDKAQQGDHAAATQDVPLADRDQA